jgi:hypothetical protein
MIPGSPVTDTVQGFAPLASLLCQVAPEKLLLAQQRLEGLGREELIGRFREAFANDKRLVAHIMSVELTWRGVPPCFRHECLIWDGASVNQRYDLLMADLAWLRRWHSDHAKVVRYRRCKVLIAGSDTQFQRESEYAYWAGRRPAWKLVGSLSLTEHQQWDCAWLRSTPIKKKAAMINAASRQVLDVLRADLQATRRTAAFGELEAEAALRRRHALWRCARIVGEGSPTAIATRYTQLTGDPITRQLAAKHLEKMRSALARSKLTQ